MLFLLLGACAGGSLIADGIDPFAVGSAVWLDVVSPADGAHAHHLVLAEQPDFCTYFQAGSAKLAALEADLGSGNATTCDDGDRLIEIGEAFGPLVTAGARELDFALPSSPEVQQYSTADADGEDVGPEFAGWFVTHLGDPYTTVGKGGDCEDPDGIWASVDESGAGEEALKADPATLEVTEVGAGAVTAQASGTLHVSGEDAESEVDPGGFDASGTFTYCAATGFYDLFRASSPALTTETEERPAEE